MTRGVSTRSLTACVCLCVLTLLASLVQGQTAVVDTVTLSLSRRTGGALHVVWGASNPSNIHSYTVRLNDSLIDTVAPSTTSYSLYGLVAHTFYNVTVQGALLNADSNGSLLLHSNELLTTTLNATIPEPPSQPQLISAGGGFLRVRVSPPLDTGGAPLSNILVSVRSQVDFSSWSRSNPPHELEFTVNGLTAKSTYRVRAYVINTEGLYSSQSVALFPSTTEAQYPGPCPPPTILNITGGSIAVQLNPPEDDGGARIKGYVVYMAVNGSGVFEEVTNTVLSEPFDVVDIRRLPGKPTTPLAPLTPYDIKAVAVSTMDVCLNPSSLLNSSITGNATTVQTTAASLPEAPPAPYFLSGTGNRVTIQLLMPGNMQGAVLTGYSILVNGSLHSSVVAGDERVFEITSLTALSTYAVQVSVLTDVGESAPSAELIVSTASAIAPSPPYNVKVTEVTSSHAMLQWSPPVDSGGAPITDYRVTLLLASSSKSLHTNSTSTSYRLTTLVANTVYTVKIVAINAAARESTTSRIKGVTFQTLAATKPSEPFGVRAVSATGGTLEIAWRTPVANGGVRDDELVYNATIFSVGSCFNSSSDLLDDACRACDLVRVPAATEQYNFTRGEQHCAQPTVPACPDGTTACCVTTANSSFTGGHLCSRITTGQQAKYRVVSGGATVTRFHGLDHSTTYYVGVQAANVVGTSTFSPLFAMRTTSQTAPGFPTSIRRTGGTGGSVELSWSPPFDTGGTTIAGYNVYRDYRQLTPAPVFPPFVDCGNGLLANSQYSYGVVAVNASRLEGSMASLLVTTPYVTLPNPIRLELAARAVAWLNVSVIAGCDTGGSPALSYQYIVRQNDVIIGSGFFACCSLLLPGLLADQNYQVSVRVGNEAGSLNWVDATFSTTTGIPATPSWRLQRANTYSLVLKTVPTDAPDPEIEAYEVLVYRDDQSIHTETVYCNSIIGPGHRACPETYRLDGLSANTTYQVSTRAFGPRGASNVSLAVFTTSNESSGGFVITSQEYSVRSGDLVNVTVQRVDGTAGPLSVVIDVAQPETVVLRCECQAAMGCACGLHLTSSGATSLPGTLTFLDGQETQTVQISVWEDDQATLQSMAVLLHLLGPSVVAGAPSQTLLHVSPSQRTGFPCFLQSKTEIVENAPQLLVNVIRVNGSSGPLLLDVETFDISSSATKHYVALSQSVQMTDRQSVVSFAIQLLDNSYFEGARVFGIRVRDKSADVSTGFSRPRAVITRRIVILDDEDPSMQLPQMPQGVTLVRATGGELELMWQDSMAWGVSVGGYLVRMTTPSTGNDFARLFNISAMPRFTLSSLQPQTLYRLQVAAWNAYGASEFTDTVLGMTTAASPASEPQNFRAVASGSTTLELAWSAPRDNGGAIITGYVVWRQWEDMVFRPLVNMSSTTTSHTVQDLMASTPYAFLIAASSTGFPATLASATASLTAWTSQPTIAAKPPPPEWIRPATAGSLSFLIREPRDLGGIMISDYSLYLRKKPAFDSEDASIVVEQPFQVVCSDATPWVNGSSSRLCTVYHLLAATSYEAYVVLHNAAGSSEPSDLVFADTTSTMTLPTAPLDFRASHITSGNVYLNWERPLDLGGVDEVLGYTVYQKMDAFFSNEFFVVYDGRESTTRQVALKGLTRSTTYAYAVVAQNAASYCVNLAAQQLTPFITVTTLPYSRLSPPQSIVRLAATGGSITIGWSIPDDLAGVPLHGYTVELVLDEVGEVTQPLTPEMIYSGTTQFVHNKLTEQTTYRYAVTALNQDGPSERSMIVTFTTTVCTPPLWVQNPQFVQGSGGFVVISWDPPLDTGGREIVNYQIARADRREAVYTSTTLTFTDMYGLSAHSQYVYVVRAFNGLYVGQESQVWAFTTEPTVPDAPLLVSTESFGGSIQVNWTSPHNTGGIPIVVYTATLLDSNTTTTIALYQGMETSYRFISLNATTTYVLTIQATNGVGSGATGQFAVYTSAVDLPSAPPAPLATEILGGSVRLTVFQPSYTGGENVTLVLHNGTSVVYTFTQDDTSTVVMGLAAFSEYRFFVLARNSRGETNGTELVVSTGEISMPSQVDVVQLMEASFDRLTVSWPPVRDTGGDVALQYEVAFFQSDEMGVALPGSVMNQTMTTSLNMTLLRLAHTSNYSFTVRAVTSTNLFGAFSPAAIFATEQPLQGRMTAHLSELVVRENSGVVVVPLLRVEGSYGDIQYSYETMDETAFAGMNYANTVGSLVTMASGVKTGTIQIVLGNDDRYRENTTFVVIVRDVPTDTTTQTRVVLLDDGDAGFLSFAQPQFAFLENTGTMFVQITRNGGLTPQVEIEVDVVATHAAVASRFTLVNSAITFYAGETIHELTVVLEDDTVFQYWPDSISLGLRVVSGGAWLGQFATTNITALDDGDVSPAKEITSLRMVSATGGSMQLQWLPPMDRGGANVELSYQLALLRNGETVVNTTAVTNSAVVYNLNASTLYQAVVSVINPAGVGLASNPTPFSTTLATPPSAPLDVAVIAASSSTLLLTWTPPLDEGGARIVSYKVFNILSNGTSTPFSVVSCTLPTVCSIQRLVALTNYTVQVRASSALVSTGGALSIPAVFQTSNPDVPDPPPPANVTWSSAGAMTIKMFKPINVGGSDVERYRLFLRAPQDVDFVMKYEGTADTYTVYRLERRTNYEIKYQVINTVGASAFGVSFFYQTMERSLPSAPLNLTSVSATGGAIALRWDEPLDIGGRPVSGYIVFMRKPSEPATAVVVGYDGKANAATSGIVYGLNASTAYTMYVIAYSEVSNCYSPTELVASASVELSTTLATLPTPAPSVVLVRYTGGIVEIAWSPPIDAGGVAIDGYTLSLVSPTGTIPLYATRGNGRRSFVHNDLIESTVYTYMVHANTTVGDSPMSEPLVVKTLIATAPSAPLTLRQLGYVTGGAIQIAWDRPIDTGGQPLKAYWVYRDGAAVAQNIPANTTSHIDKLNLRAATSYEYTVRAFSWSAMGSELSAPLTAKTTAATKPQLPLVLQNTTGASFIDVTWAPDPDMGGMPVTLFEAKLLQGSLTAGIYTGDATKFRFTRLLARTPYTLQLVSYSQIGASATLSVAFTTLTAGLPAAPPAPLALSVFGGNLTVEVTAPIDTGGEVVTQLRVYEATLGLLGVAPLATGVLKASFSVSGLLAETSYAITTTAINSLGEGARSPPLVVRTSKINAPGPIRVAPTMTEATGSTLSVAWLAPNDSGGDASLSYEVRFVESGVTTVAPLQLLSLSRRLLATGLKFFTVYSVSVRAISVAGRGEWSPVLSARTLPDAAGEFNMASAALNVSENVGVCVFTVTRTSGLSGTVNVLFSVSASGANAAAIGSDYALSAASSPKTTTTATITFSALQVSASASIVILNDGVFEWPNEQFTVQLISTTAVGTSSLVLPPKIGANATTVVTILDDGDAGYVSFSRPSYSVAEDAVAFDVTIIREDGISGRIVLSVVYTDGSARGDRDYRRPVGMTVTMEEGQTSTTLRVFIINDKTYEFPDEFFTLQLVPLSGGALPRNAVTTVVITDDGDQSVAAAPPAPVALTTTGGGATLELGLPAHNGSARGQLLSYVVRVLHPLTEEPLYNMSSAVTSQTSVGWLQPQTSYSVTYAAINTIGLGPFSPLTTFTTTEPSLPGPVVSISQSGSTGGSIQLTWLAPIDSGGVSITKYRIFSIESNNVPKLVLEISQPLLTASVLALTAHTTYRFAVQAGNAVLVPEFANGWGALGPAAEFTTFAPTLAAATTLSSTAYLPATGGSVTISWTAPLDTGGVPLLGVDVYARNATSGFTLVAQEMTPSSRSVRIEQLNGASWYEIFVLSINQVAEQSLLGVISCVTGSRSLLTSVDLSKRVTTGTVVRAGRGIFVVGDVARATKATLPLLVPHAGRSVSKAAATVMGVATQFANLSTTLPSIPRVPPRATLVNATGGALTFRVDSPGDTGGLPIDDFIVLVDGKELPANVVRKEWNTTVWLKRRLVMRITNLTPLTQYTVATVAVNAISLCDFGKKTTSASAVFQTTAVSQPAPPQIAVQIITGGGMTLGLVDPFDKGGSAIAQYQLYMATNLTKGDWTLVFVGNATAESTTAGRLSTTVAGLQSLTRYHFRMSVHNGVFESKNSSVTSITTTGISPPGQCTAPLLVAASGGMLSIAWADPPDNGGAPVIDFMVTIQPAGTATSTAKRTISSWTTRSYSFYGLSAETQYVVSVRARNERGVSVEGIPATLSTTAGSAPLGLMDVAVLSSTGGAAVISFDEPVDFGGTPRSEMLYRVFVEGTSVLTLTYADLMSSTLAGAAPSTGGRRLTSSSGGIVVGGLDPQGVYKIQTQAVNAFDAGNVSSESPVETAPASLPSEPRSLQTSSITGGSVTLTWLPPVDTGGLPLDEYAVYMATTSTGPFSVQCRDTTTECRIASLSPATSYWFYVTARNAVGESPATPVVTVVTQSISTPSAPGKIRVVSVNENAIQCSWSAPVDSGGAALTTYTILVKDDMLGTSLAPISSTTPSVVVSGLSPSTRYSITVTATNALLRVSPESAPRSVTTARAANTPAEPIVSCVSPASVSLVWNPHASATQYRLFRSGTQVYAGSATYFVDSVGVTSGTDYAYTLEAEMGGVWTGTLSSQVVVRTTDDATSTETTCAGTQGHLRETNYQPSTNKTWLLAPTSAFTVLTIEFTKFDFECDHDFISIEKGDDNTVLWRGGCQRSGSLVFQATSSVRIRLVSDATIQKTGVELYFETDRFAAVDMPTRIPAPASASGAVCSGRGQRQNGGVCKCSVGFTGEACSNHIVCCTDATSRCANTVCARDPSRVIVVSSEFGDDVSGTGAMMDTSDTGTSSKAVKTLTKALSLARDGDVVFVYPGVYSGPLNRDLQLYGRKNLTIQSLKGFAWTTIDCEGVARAMQLTESSLEIQGFTIRNGSTVSADSDGGSIVVTDSTLTMRNMLITGSSATRNGGAIAAVRSTITASLSSVEKCAAPIGGGGGVYVVDSQLVLQESNVTSCTARSGAALLMEGVSLVSGEGSARLHANNATHDGGAVLVRSGQTSLSHLEIVLNEAARGGGVFVQDGSELRFESCRVARNKASMDGGGIALLGAVTLRGNATTIEDNVAAGGGGGLCVHGGPVIATFAVHDDTAMQTRLRANRAVDGGGLLVIDAVLSLSGLLIQNGSASGHGGGVSVHRSVVRLTNVGVLSNTAASTGGGLFANHSEIISHGAVAMENNTASLHGGGLLLNHSRVVGSGGGVLLVANLAVKHGGGFFASGKSSLANVTVLQCTAAHGGGGSIDQATMTTSNVNVTDCSASVSGGGLLVNASALTVVQSLIRRGSADMGGGVYTEGGSSIVGDLVVSRCTAADDGGALYATDAVTLSHVVVLNSTAKRGAGVYLDKAVAVVTNVTVSSCYASSQGGGWSATSSSLSLTDVRLDGHHSDDIGGAMMLTASSVVHHNVTVVDNDALIGGGLYLIDTEITATPLSSNSDDFVSTIAGNTAQDSGGNVYLQGTTTLSALLISDGRAAIRGGGVAMRQANAEIRQCIVRKNTAGERGGGLSLRDGSTCHVVNAIVQDNVAQTAGGGVSILDSVMRHDNGLFQSNRARHGGGFAMDGVASLVLVDGAPSSLINASRAMQLSPQVMGNGSAIYVAPRSTVEISGLLVSHGTAGNGALFVDAATVFLHHSQFVNNAAEQGGALYANPLSSVDVVSSQFHENRATSSGGAVQLTGDRGDQSVASFTDCELVSNYAENVGGAVTIEYATLSLLRTHFETNSIGSSDGGGGAIGATKKGTLNITDCSFHHNTVLLEDAKGGALFLLADTTASLTRTTLVNNPESVFVREGGVVYVSGKSSTLSLVDCDISFGQCFAGGSIFVQEATLSLVRTTLRDGYAYEFGAGLYVDSGVADLVDCKIIDNYAFYDGGGIYVKGKAAITIRSSHLENNRVQDGGAGLFVAPGGGASVNISHTSFVLNRNRGLGSAIFVGRKTTLEVISSELLGNGGANTEGGGLYAVDALVTVRRCVFLGNRATRGAAIELSRDAKLTMTDSDLNDNQATIWGGAIYMSVRAIAGIFDSRLRNNSAATGGAAYLVGSTKLVVRDSNVTANAARSFGGAFTLVGRAALEIDKSAVTGNRAYTGGAFSITENATLALSSSELAGNTASDFGGGLYVDTLTPTASHAIHVQSLTTHDNSARAGADVYWVYHAWYEFACNSCASLTTRSGAIAVATSPTIITRGWWPSTVTSGVSLGVRKPSWKSPDSTAPAPTPAPAATNETGPGSSPEGEGDDNSTPQAPGRRRLAGSSSSPSPSSSSSSSVSSSSSSSSSVPSTADTDTLASIIANTDLTSPYVGLLWPTVVIRDFYGAIAAHDNRTRCLATKVMTEKDEFDFFPASAIDVDRGYITFTDAQVLSDSRPTPFSVYVSCTLADDVARNLLVPIVVDNCNPGYENVDGLCVPCKKGTYSLDGVKCHLCPLGATCERTDESKTVIGVSVPTRSEGFFLFGSRDSYLSSNCRDPSSWDSGDPCRNIVNASAMVTQNMTYRLQACSKEPTFDKFWPRKRVFACLASLEYYACDTRDACAAESKTPTVVARALSVQSSASPSSSLSTTSLQCDTGYSSVTCATCLSGFYKVSNGKCKRCSDPGDASVERMTKLVALVPVGFAIIAAILVWFYFSNASERGIVRQALAARKFQIYDPHARPQSLLLAAKFFVQQSIDGMMQRARDRLARGRREPSLFGIEQRRVVAPAFRAEKFKILLAFFQIFGGFKKLYEIPWPNEMSRLMDIFSIADFSLVDTTGIECFIRKDYFSNYRLSLVTVLVLLFATLLLLSWGVVRYRVKLAGLPRHCVRCGLPVFQMLRRKPKTIVRRATMVSMLRIEKKNHRERMRRRSFSTRTTDTAINKIDDTLTRLKSWWSRTRVGRMMERFVVFTRLPASCSEHFPSCPTTQEIETEVLTMVVRSNLRLWRARIRLRLNYQSFQNKCIKLLFWILLLFYPELSQRVVGMFYCDEIGRDFYMSRDKSQLCYQGTWLYYLPLTMVLLAVWVAGVPLLFWTIVFVKRRKGIDDKLLLLADPSHFQLKQRFVKEMRAELVERGVYVDDDKLKGFERYMMAEFLRNKKLNEPSMVAQVGFIYHSYRSQFWWFEVWDLSRKLILNCVIGLLAKAGANRIIAGLVVFLIYLSVLLFSKPYKESSDSALAGVTQIQLFITLFCGLMLKMGALNMEDSVIALLTYIAFFSNVATMGYAVFSILYEKFDAARSARRRAREDHRLAIQAHVRKLWRKAYGYAFTEVYFRDVSIRPMPIQVILELARRDREAQRMRELDLQLARSFHVGDHSEYEHDGDEITPSQVEFDLPRPSNVVSPRAAGSTPSSFSNNRSQKDEDAANR